MPKRTDINQMEIMDKLRQVGATVISLHTLGRDAPDILAGFCGRNYLIEIKYENGKLTPGQKDWHSKWKGQVHTAWTWQDAFRILNITIKGK